MAEDTENTESATAGSDAADDAAKAAAADAEKALEAVQAEAAAELPPQESAATAAAAPAPAQAATAPAEPEEGGPRPNRRKTREGIVVSDAMSSTVVVAVVERVRHPRYGKTVQRTKKLYVHDAEDTAKVGDRVRVQETRPLSKLKRWRLTEVVERAR
jgi:small subunit ribosomal protein S17